MKRNITSYVMAGFLLFGFLNLSIAQVQDTWTRKIDLGGKGRYGAVGFSIGLKGYIGAGSDSSNLMNDFWEYDPVAETWTQKADFGGTPRKFAVGFNIGDKGYVGTGNDSTLKNDFWEFDPIANIWMQRSDFPGTPRDGASGFGLGDKGYIGTGHDGPSSTRDDFWEYNPSDDQWIQKNNFPGGHRRWAATFVIGSNAYLGTGSDGTKLKDFWEYDPLTDSWLKKADFGGIGRYGAVGFSCMSKGFIGTGYDTISDRTDFWEYDPLLNKWTQGIDFAGTPRGISVGFSIGDKGYLGTGNDGKYQNDFWEYTPCNQPVVLTETESQSIVYGNAVSFVVKAANAVSFQWQENSGEGFVDLTDGEKYSKTLNDTLTIILPTVSMSGNKYRCIVFGGCSTSDTTDGNATLTVIEKTILVKPNENQTKVFGDIDTKIEYTVFPSLESGDEILGELSREEGENVGSYNYKLGTLDAGNNYILELDVTQTYVILPLEIIIYAEAGQSKVFGSTDPEVFTYTFAPDLLSNDSISGKLSRQAGENVGVYNFSLGTLSADSNYSLSLSLINDFSIVPQNIVITPNPGQTKDYGTSDPIEFTYTFSPDLVGDDKISGGMSREVGENVGEYEFTIGNIDAGANYTFEIDQVNKFNITPIPLNVIADNKEKCDDGNIYMEGYSASYEGFVGDDNQGDLGGSLVFEGDAITATSPGNFVISPSGLTSINYTISFIEGNLLIKPLPPAAIITRSGDKLISNSSSGNQWYKDGKEIIGATESELQVSDNGDYYTVITNNTCVSSPSNMISFLDVSLKDVNSRSFEIYPNPNKGVFVIGYNGTEDELYDVELYDNLGVVVWSQSNVIINKTKSCHVDLNLNKSGLYTLVVKSKRNNFVKKIFISH
jgi:hypothetical protein